MFSLILTSIFKNEILDDILKALFLIVYVIIIIALVFSVFFHIFFGAYGEKTYYTLTNKEISKLINHQYLGDDKEAFYNALKNRGYRDFRDCNLGFGICERSDYKSEKCKEYLKFKREDDLHRAKKLIKWKNDEILESENRLKAMKEFLGNE
ncbi:Uncharacterised protein [Campylobacter insulaenigrae]|uniref:hypothetical protein n=1 Tax=Campylobacter insulaenigrae TaxID=260714 RepID=UPI000F6E871F|nr:hypothetical protein [Campylobacter insulaenigrae]MCR6590501.1 hypothetical protein [Campylobacter insulaenigrae]MCR6592038.1 hypothetical protein [Campylobacter insulaenigrae]VEJ53309.1 Uncharacterised protein [Campylobacter insulaenigrae]